MCNFVIRPIKSYATVDITVNVEADEVGKTTIVQRNKSVEVSSVEPGIVRFSTEDFESCFLDLSTFVHVFTANPDDIERVRKEEHEVMGYKSKKADK